ncbi:nucleoside-triphosphatase [Thermogladius sp. KZ2Tp1]|uniref:nucleoside-triphosphatase n=1 Tax=Thermogladius sp. KZ2Tp1 TaxID=3136289 RepID=UPI003DA7CF1B
MGYTLVITGRPGVGKSTLFNKIVEALKSSGLAVAGFITFEERDPTGLRVGFKILDLKSRSWAWLARRDNPSPVRVGSYGVFVEEANKVVEMALKKEAVVNSDVICVDEVGPMELKLPSFKPLLISALKLGKPAILVVHYRLSDPDILRFIDRSEKVTLTLENRDELNRVLPLVVLEKVRGKRP